jgi:hypothetical protein
MHNMIMTASAWMWFSSLPCINEGTATAGPPTATAIAGGTPGTGYCDVVPGGGLISNWGDLPTVSVGAENCQSLGPFTINLTGLSFLPGMSGITEVGLPEISVCFREIYFGTVTIFGMAFDLDILSAVITGVLALRWVFRS